MPNTCGPFLFSVKQFFKQLITSSTKSSLFFNIIIPSGQDAKILNNLFPIAPYEKTSIWNSLPVSIFPLFQQLFTNSFFDGV